MATYETFTRAGGRDHFGRRTPGGVFDAYVPDLLLHRRVPLTPDNERLLAAVEREIAALGGVRGVAELPGLAPLLLRSEAAASSFMEDIAPRAGQVAFEELRAVDDERHARSAAVQVADNVRVMRRAMHGLAAAPRIELADLLGLQRDLFAGDEEHGQLREFQNWLGRDTHPLDAVYVPPSADRVSRLMEDLVAYVNDASSPPIIQADLAHAQLETIHPFPDGNGRIGRALIHLILERRGVSVGAALPISLVLMTRREDYIAGLEAFRHVGPVDGPEATTAANQWLRVFLAAVLDATQQARVIAEDLAEIQASWIRRLVEFRTSCGRSATAPRAGSNAERLLRGLVDTPVLTADTARELHGLPTSTAYQLLGEFVDAGILTRRKRERITTFAARDILDLLDMTDRRLASPRFDTRREAPVRPVATAGRRVRENVPPTETRTQQRVIGDHESGVVVTHQWSEQASRTWGKTSRESGLTLPLVRHLEDTAAVAGELWDNWLSAHDRRTMTDGLSGGEEDGRRRFAWLAGLHDLGKAAPGFAVKARFTVDFGFLADRMADVGLDCPAYSVGGAEKLPPHCAMGQFLLAEWLQASTGAGSNAAHALAAPLGGHHGTPPTALDLKSYRGSRWLGRCSPAWRALQDEIVEGMTARLGVTDRIADWVAHPPSATAQVLLTAGVVVADWLASAEERFPYDDPSPAVERAARAGLAEALIGRWEAPPQVGSAAAHFALRFPADEPRPIRPVQQVARDRAADLTGPALMVIEAPMGEGKTEGALLAAEEMARTQGCSGILVALPTMATSDEMFGRVLEWTRHLAPPGVDAGADASIHLAHGKARLNEQFRGLLRRGGTGSVVIDDGNPHESAVVTSWLQGRRKGLLATFVVGTIDQVLFGALKARHVALRHLGLAGKVIVIDEVHAADDYMRRYLVRVLEWLGAYGSPVVLLSATLPSGQRQELVEAYARGRGVRRQNVSDDLDYPRITVQSDELTEVPVPRRAADVEVDVHALPDDLPDIVGHVTELVNAGACVVVVRNTVRRAQQTYAAVRAAVGSERATLLHSQFLAAHRAHKQSRLTELLGRPGGATRRPHGFVVVGTQVLEQSLDYDADVMFSDHAPADLLLQRMGRLHRHRRGDGEGDRPPAARRARFYVVGVPDTGRAPWLEPGAAAIYGASGLLRAAAVFAEHLDGRPVRLPSDIPGLVERAYAKDLAAPPAWTAEWAAADADADDRARAARARARTFRIAEPMRLRTLIGWLDGSATDTGGDEATAGQAQVRDSEDSLEVLVVRRDSTGAVRVMDGPWRHAGEDLGVVSLAPPAPGPALAVLGCSLRLPRRLTSRGRIGALIRELEVAGWQFDGWQQSSWLQGQLVLCLDEDGRATLVGQPVRYDEEMGLLVGGQGDVP